MDLKNLLGLRPKLDTSAALQAAQQQARDQLAVCETRISALEGQHGDLLLDGDAEKIAAHERMMAEARAEAERMTALLRALPPRIEAALQRERDAGLDARAVEAEQLATAGVGLVKRIEETALLLGDLVAEHDALAAKVRDANRVLRDAGRDRIVPSVDRVWPGAQVALLAPQMRLPGPRAVVTTLSGGSEGASSSAGLRRQIEKSRIAAESLVGGEAA